MAIEERNEQTFATRQIHAGAVVDSDVGARVTPIYQSAGYVFPSYDEAEARFSGESVGRAYSRGDNPTNVVAGKRIANLEGGRNGLVVSSGQAAIAMTLFSLAASGDHILSTASLYGGTRQLFDGSLTRQGLNFEFLGADATEEEWLARVRPETRAVYTESVPNPKNDVVDLELLGRVAARAGVPLIVDNTVATPYLCRPIEWGADVVIHSTSKWLSGHGSVIGGVIIDAGKFDWAANSERFPHFTKGSFEGAPSFIERYGADTFMSYVKSVTVLDYGPTVPPTSTFLLLHGIETLSLRMERHVENAQRVAEWLEARPEVASVDYSGLPSNAYYELAQKYLPDGAGSVVSFDLPGGPDAARKFVEALELVSHMTHIGDVRTLALHMESTIFKRSTQEQRDEAGVTPGLIRLSIGIEGIDDILADLERGLEATKA